MSEGPREKEKKCSKCLTEYDATPENFCPDKKAKDGLSSWCRGCTRVACRRHRAANIGKCRMATRSWQAKSAKKIQAYGLRYRAVNCERLREKDKNYYSTLHGYIRNLFRNMNQRCGTNKAYIDRGIRNKFASPEYLIDYVINVLQIDPRGLDCHRIDPDGDYEPGNIEFLTEAQHYQVHRELKLKELTYV